MRKLRKFFFAWHSEAQFATHDVFLIEALVSLRTLRTKVVRLVACDASMELGEMKRHLYHGFGSSGALFFSVTYSGAMENSLIDHFFFVGVQQRVRNTRSMASRHLFCQVDAMVRTSITTSSSVIPRAPLSILYSFDLCACSFL